MKSKAKTSELLITYHLLSIYPIAELCICYFATAYSHLSRGLNLSVTKQIFCYLADSFCVCLSPSKIPVTHLNLNLPGRFDFDSDDKSNYSMLMVDLNVNATCYCYCYSILPTSTYPYPCISKRNGFWFCSKLRMRIEREKQLQVYIWIPCIAVLWRCFAVLCLCSLSQLLILIPLAFVDQRFCYTWIS